jgi:2-succinyl-5-enolpyruvyl-6-hydroxy-3-cyclohexene-1-carboxylate synthase
VAVTDTDRPVTVAATFASTLVDEWVRAGVTDAVVSPGSRSTPLVLALADDGRIRIHVHHDERSGAFTALGLATAQRRPCLVVTTSGTAAAELHPAVVEADLGRHPLIVCTADRPPELHDVGAPQTIDQTHLFGRSVRWFAAPGVPDETSLGWARSLGARAVVEAVGPPPGPVHLDLAFRDPLVGRSGPLPPGRAGGEPWHRRVAAPRRLAPPDAERIAATCRGRRGLIIAGAGIGAPEPVVRLARALGWPLLADPRSGCRTPDPAVVAHFDAIARSGAVDPPEVVLRLGAPPASKELAAFIERSGADQIVVDADGWWLDPARTAALVVPVDPSSAADDLAPLVDAPAPRPWLDGWTRAETAARAAIQGVLDSYDDRPTEPAVARAVCDHLPDDGTLVVSSSMPVRDVEWFATPRAGGAVHANRGANGIDGVVSTAVGVALAGAPTVALVGDVAFLHDTNGLLGASQRDLDLTVVVVDNDGGGIFSFLPPAAALAPPAFDHLFGTPHGLDLAAVAEAHDAVAHRVDDLTSLVAVLGKCTGEPGVDVVVITTDRASNVEVHDAIHAATTAAVTRAWPA